MRNFIAAIARAMAAMARTTGRWIKCAGTWIYEMIPDVGGGAVPMPPDAQHVAQAAADVRGDEDVLACIRAAAATIAAGKIPAPSISGAMDVDAYRWLVACDDDQLRKIVRADTNELMAHLQGRKSIRGVLTFDKEAIVAVEHARSRRLGLDPDNGYASTPPAGMAL